MKKKLFALMIIMLLAVGGGILYLTNSSTDDTAKQDMVDSSTPAQTQTTPEVTQETTTTKPGAYVDYSQSAIASTTGTKVLFFHAPWCPQCRDLEADIRAKQIPAGVTIIKVDYDSNQSLRQKYGVTLQTTVVKVDDQGNLVKKFVAYDSPTLDAIKVNLL